jgi:lysophospholipase L1-like esterase
VEGGTAEWKGSGVPKARLSALALLVALAACTAEPAPSPSPSSVPSSTNEAADQVYVSLGDSYATGYRPATEDGPAGSTRDGFTDLVAARTGLRLVNLACSGATSGQLRESTDCARANRAVGAPDPDGSTQLAAAVRVLRENEGRVGLVTVVIGGNDLTPCARPATPAETFTCASEAVTTIRDNLAEVLPALRAAAGDAPIVGLTYPDVFLGAWVSPEFPNGRDLARQSVPLFRDFFNTTLKAEYTAVDATFVDVTAATGAYTALTDLTDDPAYGRIPTPVAKVCALTYFCAHTDVHPTPAGHEAIAAAVLTATGR